MAHRYLTTAIPYVNAAPHIGHALEIVAVDTIARRWRARGHRVRTLTGTDDNAFKNVEAARAAGVPVGEFVRRNGDAFESLIPRLGARFDDFLRTGSDARHRRGVERLWRRWAASGDLYRAEYEGWYCSGCEAFLDSAGAGAGRCDEHVQPAELVRERNWFFRLSRYQDSIDRAIREHRLVIEPAARRNEALATIARGLDDVSVSRAAERSSGWGIPVPDDPSQTIYVWIDALCNYITALDDDETIGTWWRSAEERVHVVGKGIIRFHALYWPALLLSAGLPLPTRLWVHDHLTVERAKIAKSAGNVVDPTRLVDEFGADALRWWLVRHHPLGVDADFTVASLVSDANTDLANTIGNLVTRTVTLVHRLRAGRVPTGAWRSRGQPTTCLDDALDTYDLARAAACVVDLARHANRRLDAQRPWELARSSEPDSARRIDAALAEAIGRCRQIVDLLEPFTPELAARCRAQLGAGPTVGAAVPAYRRLPATAS